MIHVEFEASIPPNCNDQIPHHDVSSTEYHRSVDVNENSVWFSPGEELPGDCCKMSSYALCALVKDVHVAVTASGRYGRP